MPRFIEYLQGLMSCKMVHKNEIENLLRSEEVLTDEQIFAISHYLNDSKQLDIFFQSIIGNVQISMKFFDIAIYYDFILVDKSERRARIEVNFQNEKLYIYYNDETLEIFDNFLDYSTDMKCLGNDLRMRVTNELLTRFFIDILHSIYLRR